MNADSNNSSYARAPSKPLPKWMFHVIEYPGYVADIEKVFLTLGGHQSIEKSFNEQDLGSLELRYRPEDMFSHPISGDVINTSNLLLKVTRRRRKRPIPGADPSENQQTKMEIVGVINKTCRFRGIADFQYIPDQTDSIVQLRKALHNWDVEGVEHFQFSEDKGAVAPLRNMPPPAFSRVEWPQNYNYRQNEAVVKVLIKRRGDEAPVMKLINRHRRQKFVVVNFDAKWKTVPVAPPEDISAHLADVPQASLDRIKALFEKRPVWTRAAVKNNLEPEDRKHLKALLPLVSYVVTNGPWRDCWIRYGYDPRKDVEARFYQIIYVRNVKDRRAQTQAWRAKRLRGIGDSSDLVRPKLNYEAPEKKGWDEGSGSADTQSHLFDGQNYYQTGQFQLCDITDPDLVRMVQSKKAVLKAFDEKGGWYTLEHVDAIREVLRKKIFKITGRRLEDDDDEDDDDDVIDPRPDKMVEEDDDEDNDLEVGNELELGSDVGVGSSSVDVPRTQRMKDIEERVSSKVDELMRTLQSTQRAQEADQGEDEEEEGDFEYYDVFGDDDDDDMNDD